MDELTIGELEGRSGVPRRTIYFYVQQGILPPPRGAGLGARYASEHLDRLRAIPRLRSQGWRLDRIREYFDRAGDREIARAAADDGMPAVEPRLPADADVASPAAAAAPEPPLVSSETLTRYRLAPGVDLYVEQSASWRDREPLRRLLEAAAAIFRERNQPVGGLRLELRSDPKPSSE